MTFTEIVSRVSKRINQTSTASQTRIGETVNDVYKKITSSIGLNVSRRTQVQATVTLGVQTVTFTGVEKVVAVIDKSGGSDRHLDEVDIDELKHGGIAASDNATKYAIYRMNAGTVEIYLNVIPQTAFTLYADGFERASTLSGAQEPAFPESFHDILYEGTLYEELMKLEKPALAKMSKDVYEDRMGDLRIYIAKSPQQDIYQGKMSASTSSGSVSGSGGGSSVNGASSYTQTGLITFDRDPSAPFAVTASSAVVANLDADLLDGQHGSYYQSATNLNAGTLPDARFPATLPAASGVNLTALNATQLTSGTIPGARFPAVLPAVDGSALTGISTTIDNAICDGRLTLTTGVPVTVADVTGAATMYFTPYKGNRIALYDGSAWAVYTFTERSLALGTLTDARPYDVFIYNNAGTLTLEFLVWTSATVRATALVYQDGVLCKTGALTRRYLGTFYTTATTTTEDSMAKRLVWNMYNRQRRNLRRFETTDSWAYTLSTARQANANTANQVAIVVGWAEVLLEINVQVTGSSSSVGYAIVGIGEDSTTVFSANGIAGVAQSSAAGFVAPCAGGLHINPTVGYHFYPWLEWAQAAGTFTWWAEGWGPTDTENSGMRGWIEG